MGVVVPAVVGTLGTALIGWGACHPEFAHGPAGWPSELVNTVGLALPLPWTRAAIVLAFHDRLLAGRDEILDLIQLETGKTRADAFEEVAEVANVARYYARTASALARTTRLCPVRMSPAANTPGREVQ